MAVGHAFDILLFDLRLREAETLLPRLRALCPDAALLLMSTDDQPSVSAAVARLDISGILVKPFGLDTLETHIRTAMAQRSRQQPLQHVGFVGQNVTIRTPDGACRTRIFENAQDSFLIVGAPRVPTPPDFSVGRQVLVEYTGRGALYSFDSTVIREVMDPLPCWELSMPSIIRRNQRRKAPRTALQAPIRLDSASGLLCEGTTTDVSVLGLALLASTDAEVGTHVEFTIEPAMRGSATILRIEPHTDADGSLLHRMALRFDEISSQVRTDLLNRIEKSDRLW
jgi:hypothetical protein